MNRLAFCCNNYSYKEINFNVTALISISFVTHTNKEALEGSRIIHHN